MGPAVWGTATMLATLFMGPSLGKWADKTNRRHVVKTGVSMQAMAVVGATLTLFVFSALLPPQKNSWLNALAVFTFTVFGIIEKLGMNLSDVSVKREWAPRLLPGPKDADDKSSLLARTNSQMSQIDLATEVFGPFIAGLLITTAKIEFFSNLITKIMLPVDAGFIAVGILNALSFAPQLRLLLQIYNARSSSLQPIPPEKVTAKQGPVPPSGAWCVWAKHPGGLQLLSLSFAMCYLTVLSPHGLLLTAYLMMAKVPSWELSLLRGAGAAVGLLGVMGHDKFAKCIGEVPANAMCILELAIAMGTALFSFQYTLGIPGMSMPMFIFMAAVCLGRPGLYAFELGILNTELDLADAPARSRIGAVDNALQACFTLIMYAAGMVLSTPEDFGILVLASSICIAAAALMFFVWAACFTTHTHRHGQPNDDAAGGHYHDHTHTMQQMETMATGNGVHTHVHFHPSCVLL
eukprot:NODE_4369_length_1900_cov_14.602369.p1 GENE.NODE_4369_length_1900_cov_14.602369~~NODE_4369_length_1900_cov_14.602369.p1  ORF type:complete len:512 (+),score=132.34 NODE_4369_length_1900_cov_14.602369:145-1536(+)